MSKMRAFKVLTRTFTSALFEGTALFILRIVLVDVLKISLFMSVYLSDVSFTSRGLFF